MAFYRYPWAHFPDVLIHADEKSVRDHPDYASAKSGDSDSAYRLVKAFLSAEVIRHLKDTNFPTKPILISAHAVEREGVNAIPEALAEALAMQLEWEVEHEVVQTNIVSHTKADGFSRMARQAEFDGQIFPHQHYFLVDDFVGQGGTLANLRGWVHHQGGHAVGATVLTGKPYSAKLTIEPEQIDELKKKHGCQLQEWWQSQFGFDYDCLTSSEARYLIRTPSADRIRDRIIAAVQD